ncbi:YuiA family protein [Bacillus halotolerans]|nr:YuiA family protein [Bacillus halotolerans]MBJ7571852.1 YuiA family protein [Bacillus halotolerans]MBL4977807.1 YuiA family protein [Bacillus halotolerans]
MKTATTTASQACPFCLGKGYFQLILGGSETCPSCQGTGKDSHSFSSR